MDAYKAYGDEMDTTKTSSSGKKCSQKCANILKSNLLLIFLLVGIVAGIVVGVVIRAADDDFRDNERHVMYLGFLGDLFLRMLKCCIIPMIVTSLIAGMAAIPGQAAGRMGAIAVLYYMSTTFLAVVLGIILVTTIQPGTREVDESIKEDKDKLLQPIDSVLDLFRRCFPDNIMTACFEQSQTQYTTEEVYENKTNDFNETEEVFKKDKITGFTVGKTSGTNVIGLVVFSVTLGLVVGRMGEAGRPVREFVNSFQEAVLQIVTLVIWLSPIGIASILAARIVSMKDPETAFTQLGWYMLTVLAGLAAHGFIVLPLIYLVITRSNPFKLMVKMSKAMLTALGTASSSATLPITMKCLEENAGIDARVSKFVLPVGATINMDGTALYEAVASIFIAQINDFSLDAGQIIIISITATAAAIGAAGVPEAGLVTMVIVLTAVGLPTDDIGLIIAVDWFLDRFRTMINVWGDSIGAGIVAHTCRDQLEKSESDTTSQNEADPDNFDDVINENHFRPRDPVENGYTKPAAYNPAFVPDHNDVNVRF